MKLLFRMLGIALLLYYARSRQRASAPDPVPIREPVTT